MSKRSASSDPEEKAAHTAPRRANWAREPRRQVAVDQDEMPEKRIAGITAAFAEVLGIGEKGAPSILAEYDDVPQERIVLAWHPGPPLPAIREVTQEQARAEGGVEFVFTLARDTLGRPIVNMRANHPVDNPHPSLGQTWALNLAYREPDDAFMTSLYAIDEYADGGHVVVASVVVAPDQLWVEGVYNTAFTVAAKAVAGDLDGVRRLLSLVAPKPVRTDFITDLGTKTITVAVKRNLSHYPTIKDRVWCRFYTEGRFVIMTPSLQWEFPLRRASGGSRADEIDEYPSDGRVYQFPTHVEADGTAVVHGLDTHCIITFRGDAARLELFETSERSVFVLHFEGDERKWLLSVLRSRAAIQAEMDDPRHFAFQ
jgi:hypothetical protein